jgi:hypothetical protein
LDGWFTLVERSRAAVNRLLHYGSLLSKRSPYRNNLGYQPQLEGLEGRVLMTSVSWHTSSQQVNYNAGAVIEADLSASSGSTITVNYATADGTAAAGTDYTSTSGTLTFAPGTTQATFLVPLLNKKEGSNLTFTATLSSPTNATLGATTTDTVTIVNTPLTSAAVDVNAYLVLPPNAPVNTPINTFSGWSMSVKAQTDGAIVSSYSWSFSTGSDATFINNSNGYNLTWAWASFNGAARTNTLTLTEVAAIPGSGRG